MSFGIPASAELHVQIFSDVQLVKIEKKYHSLIRRAIERQLAYQPDLETKNRKPLLRPSVLGSAWELRFGPENRFRVFYRTEADLRQVHILAVGVRIKDQCLLAERSLIYEGCTIGRG